jgi:hypothetical protein
MALLSLPVGRCLTVTDGREAHDMFLHAHQYESACPTAFHAIETFGFPSLLAYPAINRLPGNTQTLRQLFRGHFAA